MSGGSGAGARRRDTESAVATAELERDYGRLEPEVIRTVRGKLAAIGAPNDDDTLTASYNQAWHALYNARADGDDIANPAGFLVQVTYRRALDEHRATARREISRQLTGVAVEAVDPELEQRLDDHLRVRALMQGMHERLDARELRAATLCYVHGYTRPEAARALGVRPRRFEKVMDHVSKELSALVGDLREGAWCESRRSLIGAYALGVLDPEGERYRLATAHLEDCPACRRRVLCMRGLAGMVPPMALLPGAAGGSGAAALAERWDWLARIGGHTTEIAAGGAAVAVATSLVVVLAPSDDDPAPAPTAAVATAPLPASSSAGLRAAAASSVARARVLARGPKQDARRHRAAMPAAVPPAPAPPIDAEQTPTATPPSSQPAPATPPAAPADDGWEEFELRR